MYNNNFHIKLQYLLIVHRPSLLYFTSFLWIVTGIIESSNQVNVKKKQSMLNWCDEHRVKGIILINIDCCVWIIKVGYHFISTILWCNV